MTKYNLSFKRIISHLVITFFVGILFGVLIIPFLTTTGGLLFEQRAAIGGQNIIKMVALWGLYTLIFSLFSFWKKRLRMASVLLIICFLLSVVFVVYLNLSPKQQKRCNRINSFTLPKEFSRSIDLIAQRLNVEETNYGYFDRAMDYANCLDIQYSDTNNLGSDLEAYFSPAESNLQHLKIVINPRYQKFDDLSIATILIHELSHVGKYINQTFQPSTSQINNVDNCFSEEADAFLDQLKFIQQLNDEEKRSIFTRLRENISINPAFPIVLSLTELGDESFYACQKLKQENELNQQQFSDCTWQGTKNKLDKIIRKDEYYIKQCSQ